MFGQGAEGLFQNCSSRRQEALISSKSNARLGVHKVAGGGIMVAEGGMTVAEGRRSKRLVKL